MRYDRGGNDGYERVAPQIERQKRERFTEEQKKKIFDGIRDGKSVKEIAAELGVDPKKVGKFKQNNSVRIRYMMGRKIDGTPAPEPLHIRAGSGSAAPFSGARWSRTDGATAEPAPEPPEPPEAEQIAPEPEQIAQEAEREAPKPEQEVTVPEPEAPGGGEKLRALNAAIVHLEKLVETGGPSAGVTEIAEVLAREMKSERMRIYEYAIDWDGIADRLEA